MDVVGTPIIEALDGYRAQDPAEAADVGRVRELAGTAPDPWLRSNPVHATASALVVHPPSGRVLMRRHPGLRSWLLVGGHGDPGERHPLAVVLREGAEETGLTDLTPWPDASLVHVAVVPVPARGGEPAHEHADLRFVLATARPDDARPENPDAPLRWLTPAEAVENTALANVRDTIRRVERLLAAAGR